MTHQQMLMLSMSLHAAVLIFHALAHETRWRILARLLEGPLTVTMLSRMLGLRQPNLSNHLAVMRAAGLVVATRRGRQLHYGIAERTAPLIASLWERLGVSLENDPVLSADAWRAGGAG